MKNITEIYDYEKRSITVTSDEPNHEWLFGGNPRAIEEQEAIAQKELVESSQLPRKVNHRDIDCKEQYEAMGIEVIGESENDDLFFDVVLPDGWEIRYTDHSIWTELYDDKNRMRGNIFYKGAFYDRDSFINFDQRFYARCDTNDIKDSHMIGTYERVSKEVFFGVVYDSENLVFKTDEQLYAREYKESEHSEWWEGYEKLKRVLREEAEAWLEENYPNWKDLNAYWGNCD